MKVYLNTSVSNPRLVHRPIVTSQGKGLTVTITLVQPYQTLNPLFIVPLERYDSAHFPIYVRKQKFWLKATFQVPLNYLVHHERYHAPNLSAIFLQKVGLLQSFSGLLPKVPNHNGKESAKKQVQNDTRGTNAASVLPSPFRHKDLSLPRLSYLAWHDLPEATLSQQLESQRISTSLMFLLVHALHPDLTLLTCHRHTSEL